MFSNIYFLLFLRIYIHIVKLFKSNPSYSSTQPPTVASQKVGGRQLFVNQNIGRSAVSGLYSQSLANISQLSEVHQLLGHSSVVVVFKILKKKMFKKFGGSSSQAVWWCTGVASQYSDGCSQQFQQPRTMAAHLPPPTTALCLLRRERERETVKSQSN